MSCGADVRVVAHAGVARLAPLGRDEHDAVGAARPVDRRGAGVLEHLDRLDVARVQVADAAGHRDAVKNVERIVRRLERALAADTNPHGAPGV